MAKPVIFTAADAASLDDLLAKISAMALDLLPDNPPGVDPASVFLQLTALREADRPRPDGAAVRPAAPHVGSALAGGAGCREARGMSSSQTTPDGAKVSVLLP
jgi:hypothetical protein